jgi:hypothetical protein
VELIPVISQVHAQKSYLDETGAAVRLTILRVLVSGILSDRFHLHIISYGLLTL